MFSVEREELELMLDVDANPAFDDSQNSAESSGEDCTQEEALMHPRYVFAHFMVGNTYPYTVNDWLSDIKLAASSLLDGFVLNVGPEDWQRDRVADCFNAAAELPETTRFTFIFSFDMSTIPGSSADDLMYLKAYYQAHANDPRMFRHPRTGGATISTFSGENCTFGQHSMECGWEYVKDELSAITPAYFVPSFFIDPSRYGDISALDGAFNWNGGWPLNISSTSARNVIVNAKLDTDDACIENLTGGRTFMAAVSPWFFTHYGPDTWNKNWIYRGDDWLFVRRWEQLISMRSKIDIVQVISWNDYGESHYIGPIKGAQPNSQAWVDGYPHEAWLSLNAYFTAAFKKGVYPPIRKDQIFLWARPHPKASTSSDHVPRPTNWELTDDKIWVIVFTTGSAKVEISTSQNRRVIFNVPAGMSRLSAESEPDGGMCGRILRNNVVVAECCPIGYRFESRPGVYNFNVAVAMSR